MDLLVYLDILKRRRWLVIIPIVVIGGMTSFVGFLTPKEYSGTMTLVIEEAFATDRLVQGLVAPTDVGSRVNVVKATITSESFADRLVEKLQASGKLGPQTDWYGIKYAVRARSNIEMVTRSLRPNANDLIMRFSLTMNDPALVPVVLEGMAEGFVEESTRPQKEAAAAATDFLSKQVEQFDRELQEIEEQIKEMKMNNFDALPGSYNKAVERLTGLESQLQEMRITETELEARRQDIVTQLVENNPDMLRLKGELAQATARYTQHHPLVQNLQQQLRNLEERLAAEQHSFRRSGELDISKFIGSQDGPYQRMIDLYGLPGGIKVEPLQKEGEKGGGLQGDAAVEMTIANLTELQQADRQLKVLRARRSAIEAAIGGQKEQAVAIPAKEQQYTDLTRFYETLQERYVKAYQRLQEARLSNELDYIDSQQRYKVLQKPGRQGTPIQAPKMQLLIMGLVMSLFTGLGLAFVVEFFDSRFYTPAHFSRNFSVPVLGHVPNQFKRSQSHE